MVLSGGLSGTMSEVKSVTLCSDPARTGGGYASTFSTSLAGVAYSFAVMVGASYKGPGTYATGTDGTVGLRGPTIRDNWDAVAGGTITVAADGSGTVDTDLKNPTVTTTAHVKGTFACK